MTLPLFVDLAVQQRENCLRSVFHAWIDHRATSPSRARHERALREESATVYQEMWHAFAAFCAARSLEIASLRCNDIEAFLALRAGVHRREPLHGGAKTHLLSLRYCWRMLTLIDRVARFHAHREGVPPNTAAYELLQRPAYRYANASHSDPLPEYYSEAQAKRLIAFLTGIRSDDGSCDHLSWKETRDRTAVALMLGGGLAPGDIRVINLNGIITDGDSQPAIPWKLSLPGNGNSPARETPLAEWAGRQLVSWLAVRQQQAIAGDLVFPSTLSGKAWSHTACYEACKAVLASAGMAKTSGGVFQLRHTFALRQLASGKTEQEVAQWLGFVDINGMARYRRIVQNQVDLV